MVKITNKEINITFHPVDGFTLSYLSDNKGYFKQRYIGYGICEAKRLFKQYVYEGVTK